MLVSLFLEIILVGWWLAWLIGLLQHPRALDSYLLAILPQMREEVRGVKWGAKGYNPVSGSLQFRFIGSVCYSNISLSAKPKMVKWKHRTPGWQPAHYIFWPYCRIMPKPKVLAYQLMPRTSAFILEDRLLWLIWKSSEIVGVSGTVDGDADVELMLKIWLIVENLLEMGVEIPNGR